MIYFIQRILNNMFRPVFRPSSDCLSYYKNTIVIIVLEFLTKIIQLQLLWSDGDTANHNCILVIIISPWRWPKYRPKHVGENTVNRMYHKY